MAQVVLCDDHELMTEGQRRILERLGHTVVAVFRNGRDLVAYLKTHAVDLVILDISMPLQNGLDALVSIRECAPAVKCIVMSMHEDHQRVTTAFRNGARAYVSKIASADEFEKGLHAVLQGETFVNDKLSPKIIDAYTKAMAAHEALYTVRKMSLREREVLQLVAEGKSDKESASILEVTVPTIRYHRERLAKAYELKTLADFIRLAHREGLIDLTSE